MQHGQPPVRWGVMFGDGSVRSRWNGQTQRQRATEEADKLRTAWPQDDITLAYREGPGHPWFRVDNDYKEES